MPFFLAFLGVSRVLFQKRKEQLFVELSLQLKGKLNKKLFNRLSYYMVASIEMGEVGW